MQRTIDFVMCVAKRGRGGVAVCYKMKGGPVPFCNPTPRCLVGRDVSHCIPSYADALHVERYVL